MANNTTTGRSTPLNSRMLLCKGKPIILCYQSVHMYYVHIMLTVRKRIQLYSAGKVAYMEICPFTFNTCNVQYNAINWKKSVSKNIELP